MGNSLSSGPPLPPASDGEVTAHAELSPTSPSPSHPGFARAVRTSFELPLSSARSDDFFFVSRGSSGAGELSIVEDADRNQKGQIALRVEVMVLFKDEAALEEMTIVSLKKPGGETGVGIYTPRTFYVRVPLFFVIRVIVPAGAAAPPSLCTSMSNSSISISLPTAHLSSLTCSTSNGPIDASGCNVAESLRLWTSNASIRGSFVAPSVHLETTNRSIEGGVEGSQIALLTSNAPISMEAVRLHSSSTATTPSSLRVVSSNAAISIPSILLPAHEPVSVSLETSNHPITVAFARSPPPYSSFTSSASAPTSAPPSSRLSSFKIVTSNASILVKLAHDGSAFEGKVKARTSGPAGVHLRGEHAHVDSSVNGNVEGTLGSSVRGGADRWELVSSNAPVCLNLVDDE